LIAELHAGLGVCGCDAKKDDRNDERALHRALLRLLPSQSCAVARAARQHPIRKK
jgi:hypothetical protein